MRVGLWGWVCGRVCLGYYMCLLLSGNICASVCLCVCAIQSRTEEGKSSGSMFYLTLYETLVNCLKRNGIPQVTDIGTVKKLPEDLTLAGSVITNTCKALPCKGERCTCQPTSAWRKETGLQPWAEEGQPFFCALLSHSCLRDLPLSLHWILQHCFRSYYLHCVPKDPFVPTCVCPGRLRFL